MNEIAVKRALRELVEEIAAEYGDRSPEPVEVVYRFLAMGFRPQDKPALQEAVEELRAECLEVLAKNPEATSGSGPAQLQRISDALEGDLVGHETMARALNRTRTNKVGSEFGPSRDF